MGTPTFEDLTQLTDREVQILMREVDQKDLVMGLAGASESVKEKILGNMSERVRAFIKEEIELLGGGQREGHPGNPGAHRPAGDAAGGAGTDHLATGFCQEAAQGKEEAGQAVYRHETASGDRCCPSTG